MMTPRLSLKLRMRGARTLALSACAALLFAPGVWAQNSKPANPQHGTFTIVGDHFELNGKPFQIISGEMHYERIPRAYWRARMEMAKAMGVNTLATYVFWNVHEPRPGHFDFSGNEDLVAFLKLAQEEHLYVLLRAGPYSCAEWELGGFPSWLLKTPEGRKGLRSNAPAFMVPAERWLRRLAKETAPLQIGRGGPIIAVQVENEYGDFGHDTAYLEHLHRIFLGAGFTDSLLYTVDPSHALGKGSIPGVYEGVNFGTGNSDKGLAIQEKFEPGKPLFATEYWPGWFDHWGHPHETRPIDAQVKDLEYILSHGASVNIYMLHGGTSFGFMAGASWTNHQYLPDVTSYDYDAPLDEAGHPTPKFMAYRAVLAKYSKTPLPPVPTPPPVMAVNAFPLVDATALWDHLPKPVHSQWPLAMEEMDQSYGYVLYRKVLVEGAQGTLLLNGVHDYAQVYVDGKMVGTVDRRKPEPQPIELNAPKGARLDVLVENSGRINSTGMMRGELKGITGGAILSGQPLKGWDNYSLPPELFAALHEAKSGSSQQALSGPHVEFAYFDVQTPEDTFLDVSQLGKGAVWINGHAIGRYWNEGPQMTLYVPGPWLHKGHNEVVVFDMFASARQPKIEGRTQPILNAPTPSEKPVKGVTHP